MRTAAKPTADQMRVLKILEQLAGAADWRGVAAQEALHALIWQQQRDRGRVGEGERW
jgi:hypothetical protein